MLNGLDSGMRALDGLPSPRFSFPARNRARRGLLVFLEQDPSVDPGKLYRLKSRWR